MLFWKCAAGIQAPRRRAAISSERSILVLMWTLITMATVEASNIYKKYPRDTFVQFLLTIEGKLLHLCWHKTITLILLQFYVLKINILLSSILSYRQDYSYPKNTLKYRAIILVTYRPPLLTTVFVDFIHVFAVHNTDTVLFYIPVQSTK